MEQNLARTKISKVLTSRSSMLWYMGVSIGLINGFLCNSKEAHSRLLVGFLVFLIITFFAYAFYQMHIIGEIGEYIDSSDVLVSISAELIKEMIDERGALKYKASRMSHMTNQFLKGEIDYSELERQYEHEVEGDKSDS